jgi:hypothetical protein
MQLDQPANRAVLKLLESVTPGAARSSDPAEIAETDPRFDSLGTHYDLIDYLWEQLPAKLPKPYRWVIYNRPALVHPNGIVFGFAVGTLGCVLRLPAAARAEQDHPGARVLDGRPPVDVSSLEQDWVKLNWAPIERERDWCLASYHYAAALAAASPANQ